MTAIIANFNIIAIDTLWTGSIIMMLIVASLLSIYNLPWSNKELEATHTVVSKRFSMIIPFVKNLGHQTTRRGPESYAK
jgi:hypothetical protein